MLLLGVLPRDLSVAYRLKVHLVDAQAELCPFQEKDVRGDFFSSLPAPVSTPLDAERFLFEVVGLSPSLAAPGFLEGLTTPKKINTVPC